MLRAKNNPTLSLISWRVANRRRRRGMPDKGPTPCCPHVVTRVEQILKLWPALGQSRIWPAGAQFNNPHTAPQSNPGQQGSIQTIARPSDTHDAPTAQCPTQHHGYHSRHPQQSTRASLRRPDATPIIFQTVSRQSRIEWKLANSDTSD
jgi:hypothetical protein